MKIRKTELTTQNKITGGRYQVLELIGTGGNSQVFKVKDIRNGNIYAMKQYITSDPYNEKQMIKDIEGELNVLKYASHPVLPVIYNIIKEEDRFFLIMEYVEGINLKEIVVREGILSWKQLLNIMEQICSGMYYLHSLNPPIVYRDLKPSNIILKDDGSVKLVDFGVAKRYNRELEADDRAYGTRGFASPEQFGKLNGQGIYNTDIRSDIYGIGTTMYFLMTGTHYDYSGRIKSLAIPKGMKKIIRKCTQIKPNDRYDNCIRVLSQLYICKIPIWYKLFFPIIRKLVKPHLR